MERDYGANRELRRILEARGMSVAALAERSGIRRASLNRILQGEQSLYADQLLPLARALWVSVDALLGLDRKE